MGRILSYEIITEMKLKGIERKQIKEESADVMRANAILKFWKSLWYNTASVCLLSSDKQLK